MYVPAIFSESDLGSISNFIDQHPLATLIGIADNRPAVDHIPFLRDQHLAIGSRLIAHVAKGNSTWRLTESCDQWVLVFTGATAYVSPSFYPSKKVTHEVVPTYNYVSIHLRGIVRHSHDRAEKLRCVEALTRTMESSRPEPWAVSDAPSPYIDKMLEGIVALSFEVTDILAKRKASQNRPLPDQRGVFEGLRSEPSTAEAARIIGGRLTD